MSLKVVNNPGRVANGHRSVSFKHAACFKDTRRVQHAPSVLKHAAVSTRGARHRLRPWSSSETCGFQPSITAEERDLAVALGGAAVAHRILAKATAPRLDQPTARPAASTSLDDLTAMINSLVAAAAAGPTAVPYVSNLPAKKPVDDVPDGQLLLTGYAGVKDALLDLAQALTAALAQPLATPPSITSSSTGADKSLAPSAARVQQALDDWADRVLPATAGAKGSSTSSRTLAKTLFKHLMAGSSPGTAGEGGSLANTCCAQRKTAAAAAASTSMAGDASTGTAPTAGSGRGRVPASVRHPKAAVTTLGTYPAGVPADGVPATASDGQDLKTILPSPGVVGGRAVDGTALSPMAAAAAVSSDSNTFDPDAWEAAAEAAAAAAGAASSSMGINSAESPPDVGVNPATAPDMTCWIVQLLAESLQRAAQAEGSARQPAAAALQPPGVCQLSLLPAADAVAQLRLLDPVEHIGLLLLLVLGNVTRGHQWLLHVLAGMTDRLGLAETGVLLAAVHHRFGRRLFRQAAELLLPLKDPADPCITMTGHLPAAAAAAAATSPAAPAAVVQSLLLHWLLKPQLAAAGLPTLPEDELARLLPEITAACTSKQLQLAAQWGVPAPVTLLLDMAHRSGAGSAHSHTAPEGASAPNTGNWQLCLPSIASSGCLGAWLGLPGITLGHLARVIATAATATAGHGKMTGGLKQRPQPGSQCTYISDSNAARSVVRAVLRGLEPLQPLLLLVVQQVLLLPSSAESRKLQLVQLLLEAGSSSLFKVMSVAGLVDVCLRVADQQQRTSNGSTNSASSSQATSCTVHLVSAASDTLLALPPETFQDQLDELMELQAEQCWKQQGCSRKVQPAAEANSTVQGLPAESSVCPTPALDLLLAALAEQADAVQARGMLRVLPMPQWAAAWAAFVSPVRGIFCWSRQELTAVMSGITGGEASRMQGAGSWQQLEAAWSAVAAHFALADVGLEFQGSHCAAHVAAGPDAQKQQQQQRQQEEWQDEWQDWSDSVTYTYRPEVPFVGDGWDQAPTTHTPCAAQCFAGSFGCFVLGVLQQLSLQAAVQHIAALAAVLHPAQFARGAGELLGLLMGPGSADQGGQQDVWPSSVIRAVVKLYDALPDLSEASAAVQLLAAAAQWLPVDRAAALVIEAWALVAALQRIPGWDLSAAATGGGVHQRRASAEEVDDSQEQQMALIIAAAGLGRDSVGLQHLAGRLMMLAVDVDQAQLVLDVLGCGLSEPALAEFLQQLQRRRQQRQVAADGRTEVSSISRATPAGPATSRSSNSSSSSSLTTTSSTINDEDVVWQMGQGQSMAAAAAPAGNPPQVASGAVHQGAATDGPAISSAAAAGGVDLTSGGGSTPTDKCGDAYEADRALLRQLERLVTWMPPVPPAGSFSMDAMQDPSRVASQIKSIISLLISWSPSCPAAAAMTAQQLHVLFNKRAWSTADTAAVLQRLPLRTALQLLLEGSSGSNWWKVRRGRLLSALVDWHGWVDTVSAVRLLFAQYNQQNLAAFVELLANLRPAAAAVASGSTGGSSSSRHSMATAELLGTAAAAPNAFVASVLHVLGIMTPTSAGDLAPSSPPSSSSSSTDPWTLPLSRLLCRLAVEVPGGSLSQLTEAVGRSLVQTRQDQHSLSAPHQTGPTSGGGWRRHVAGLLATLPSAGVDPRASWVTVAVGIAAGVTAAAGSAALLHVLAAAVEMSAAPAAHAGMGGTCQAVAAQLPELLQLLQDQGLMTCGDQAAALPGDSSSSSSGGGGGGDGVHTQPPCISVQLVLLLQQLHQKKLLTLQQSVAALIAVSPTLDKHFPQAVVLVFGHPKARGYGASGPDAAAAMAALEEATAATTLLPPTAAAVPAAAAAAAKQLSEVLAYCHEMLPGHLMRQLMLSLSTYIPWQQAPLYSSSSTGPVCAADEGWQQHGWSEVSQLLLVTSSLLTASCAMWGVDKGTVVAGSLISLMVEAGGPAAAVGTDSVGAVPTMAAASEAAAPTATNSIFRRYSPIASGSKSSANVGVLADVTAAGPATWACSTAVYSAGSGHKSGQHLQQQQQQQQSHAAAAEAALRAAEASGTDGDGEQAACAAAALQTAAASGGSSTSSTSRVRSSEPGMSWRCSHTQRAEHALLRAAASGSSTHGHAKVAESKLLDAVGGSPCLGPPASTAALLWGVQQLQAVADRVSAGGVGARSAVAEVMSLLKIAPMDMGGRGDLQPDEAAAGLLAALRLLLLPADVTVQVLVQTEGWVLVGAWGAALLDVVAAATAGGDKKQKEQQEQQQHSHVLELLMLLVQEIQRQRRVDVTAACLYKEVILVAAAAAAVATTATSSGGSSGNAALHRGLHTGVLTAALSPLLQLMLTGRAADSSGSSVPLSASAAGQLIIELSRPRLQPTKQRRGESDLTWQGGRDAGSDAAAAAAAQQLVIVEIAAAAALQHFSTTSSSAVDIFSNCVAQQLHQVTLLPRLYLTMLLEPCLSQQHYTLAVQQSGLMSAADAREVITALQLLCQQLLSGRSLPLARYAQLLATTLDITSSQDFTSVSSPEARLALEMEQRHMQQQLLAAVVHVLGTFRGMRALLHPPAAAGLLLPSADLAAVLCYSWQLLPPGHAEDLAAAVAVAASSQQLVELLLLLPSAAAAGFGKGPELWHPVLHHMAAAAGWSAAEEADVVDQVVAVAAEQVPQVPVTIEGSNTCGNEVGATVNAAEPAQPVAAAGPVAVPASAGDSTVAGDTDTPPGEEVMSTGDRLDALEALAVVSVAVASSVTTGALAAGYGAAGAVVGLLWGAASLAAAALVPADSSTSSNVSDPQQASDSWDCALAPATPTIHEHQPAAAAAAAMHRIPNSQMTVTPAEAGRVALMGGRTKGPAAQDVISGGAAADPAAAGYAGLGVAAAAVAAAGCKGSSGGSAVLGSLLVDPDEVVQKIRSQSAGLPLDQAMMQVVPLLLLAGSSSTSPDLTWPQLALSAIVHSKHPAVNTTLGGSSSSSSLHLLNIALQATFQDAEGPLATLMHAARCMAATQAGSFDRPGMQEQQQGQAALEAALAAAEAVDPWAVSMQLSCRFITAVWDALMSRNTSSSVDRRPDAALAGAAPAAATAAYSSGTVGRLATAEAAVDAWQTLVTDLLSGCYEDHVSFRLLDDFARRQGSWEAELRALAVAAALQQQGRMKLSLLPANRPRTHSGAVHILPMGLFQRLLAEACRRQKLPPVSFLVMLLQSKQVPLSPADTAVVLRQAVEQLLDSQGSAVPPHNVGAGTEAATGSAGNLGSNNTASGASGKSSNLHRHENFEAWDFEGLFSSLDLFGDGYGDCSFSLLGKGSSPVFYPSAAGPRYISTTAYINMRDEAEVKGSPRVAVTAPGTTGTGSGANWSPPAVALPAAVITLVKALVDGALGRGHGLEALDFVMHLILLVQPSEQQQAQSRLGSDDAAADMTPGSSSTAGRTLSAAKLVMHDSPLHQLLGLAADSCIAALGSAAAGAPEASNASSSWGSKGAWTAGGMTLPADEMLPAVLLDLVAVLAADGQVDKCCQVAIAVCAALTQQHVTNRTACAWSRNSAVMGPGGAAAAGHGAVTVDIAGKVLTMAAAAVEEVEGTVSAAKPLTSQLLSEASDALFTGLAMEQRLVLLAEVVPHLPQRLGLQLVAASAGKLHSVMPQAVAIVRSADVRC